MGLETVRVAFGGLAANKLRTALTVLGMAIGVAAVIVLVAVGNGSSRSVQSSIESLGANVLLVMGTGARGGPGAPAASSATLSEADAKALADPAQAPDVASASPVVNASSATLVNGSVSYQPGAVVGTTPSYFRARDVTAQAGELFTAADVTAHERVVVLGPTVVESLFGAGANPVGQTAQVNGIAFQVVGVTAPKGASGAQDSDDVVLMPFTTAQDTLTGYGSVDRLAGAVDLLVVEHRAVAGEVRVGKVVAVVAHARDVVADPPLVGRVVAVRRSTAGLTGALVNPALLQGCLQRFPVLL